MGMEKRVHISTSRSAGLLAIAALWALFLLLTGSPELILFTVPVFLLAAPLAFGRYIGEGILVAARRRPARRYHPVPGLGLPEAATRLVGRQASSPITGRGPPLAAS